MQIKKDEPVKIYKGLTAENKEVLSTLLNAVGRYYMKPDIDQALGVVAMAMDCHDLWIEKIGSTGRKLDPVGLKVEHFDGGAFQGEK